MKKKESKQDPITYEIGWIEFRYGMIYTLDVYDLYRATCDLIDYMPEDGSKDLRELLCRTRDALYEEQKNLSQKYSEEYIELLKARDEVKKLKKEKKKVKK